MPAHKKHSSLRRRTNKAATATVLAEVPADEVEVPALPPRWVTVTDGDGDHRVEVAWLPETLAWWGDLWASAMSKEYCDADRHGLIRLAVLVDNYWRDPSAKTHAEVRLAQKDYGLTPYDRRRLEWTVEGAKKAKADGARRTAATPTATSPVAPAVPVSDPRLTLVANN